MPGCEFGEYSIPAGASMREILELLNQGGNVVRQVVVPEGLTSWQVVELLRAEEELSGEITEVPAEGTLAPAGYDFQRGDARADLLARMSARQEEILAAAWATRAPDLPIRSPEELLTLASIVEKETGVAEERPMVAQVFVNRLNRGMRLQTDPTVIYGITKGEGTLGRGLRASELATATPYNTYVVAGLPPGPIANPGRGGDPGGGQSRARGLLLFRGRRHRRARLCADAGGAQRQRGRLAADRGAAGRRGAGGCGGGRGGGRRGGRGGGAGGDRGHAGAGGAADAAGAGALTTSGARRAAAGRG